MSRPSRVENSDKPTEQLLWVNVVLQAIHDATDGGYSTPLERQRARTWFRLNNPDFIEVCSLAGLDPDATHEKAIAAIKRHDSIVAVTGPIKRPRHRPAMTHTYMGQSLTLRQWAQRLGVSVQTLHSRWRKLGSLDAAIAMGGKMRSNGRPGVVSDFAPSQGTGAGSTAQETPNLEFSQKAAE